MNPGTMSQLVPSVHHVLRAATASRHAAAGMVPAMRRIFSDDYTRVEYEAHLVRLLAFVDPIERIAARLMSVDDAMFFVRRAGALCEDLSAAGWTTGALDAVKPCDRLPALTRAGVPGYLYVMLGSMLGGRLIAQRLRRVLGPRTSTRFYGGGTGTMAVRWPAFCADLERREHSDMISICNAANATFDTYAAWIGSDAAEIGR